MKVILTEEEKVEVEKLTGLLGIKLDSLMYDEEELMIYVIPSVMVSALKSYNNWILSFPSSLVKAKLSHYKKVFAKYFTRGFFKKAKKTA